MRAIPLPLDVVATIIAQPVGFDNEDFRNFVRVCKVWYEACLPKAHRRRSVQLDDKLRTAALVVGAAEDQKNAHLVRLVWHLTLIGPATVFLGEISALTKALPSLRTIFLFKQITIRGEVNLPLPSIRPNVRQLTIAACSFHEPCTFWGLLEGFGKIGTLLVGSSVTAGSSELSPAAQPTRIPIIHHVNLAHAKSLVFVGRTFGTMTGACIALARGLRTLTVGLESLCSGQLDSLVASCDELTCIRIVLPEHISSYTEEQFVTLFERLRRHLARPKLVALQVQAPLLSGHSYGSRLTGIIRILQAAPSTVTRFDLHLDINCPLALADSQFKELINECKSKQFHQLRIWCSTRCSDPQAHEVQIIRTWLEGEFVTNGKMDNVEIMPVVTETLKTKLDFHFSERTLHLIHHGDGWSG